MPLGHVVPLVLSLRARPSHCEQGPLTASKALSLRARPFTVSRHGPRRRLFSVKLVFSRALMGRGPMKGARS